MPNSDDFDVEQHFAEIAHSILIGRPVGSGAKEIAQAMGMKYDTLYAKLTGRTRFRLGEILALVRHARDQRLVNALLHGTPYIAIDRIKPEGALPDSTQDAVIEAVIEVTDVLRAVKKALRDELIDHRERKDIAREVDHAEKSLAGVRHLLERGATR